METRRSSLPPGSHPPLDLLRAARRALLTAYTWIGAPYGGFSTASNWEVTSSGATSTVAPGAGDDVTIPLGGQVYVTSSTTVNSVNCQGQLYLSGGTFTVTNADSGASWSIEYLEVEYSDASFAASGGTSTINSGQSYGPLTAGAGATINLGGGFAFLNSATIGMDGSGTFVISSQVDVVDQSMPVSANLILNASGQALLGEPYGGGGLPGGSGSLVVGSGSTVTVASGSIDNLPVTISSGATLNFDGNADLASSIANSGTINIAGSATFVITLDGSSSITNNAGGNINLNSPATLGGDQGSSFTNDGTLNVSLPSGDSFGIGITLTLAQGSSINVKSGDLSIGVYSFTLSPTVTDAGSLAIAPGSLVDFAGPLVLASTSALTVQVSSATAGQAIGGQFTVTPPLEAPSIALGGSLTVQDASGFVPTLGQSYPILTPAPTGSFATTSFPTSPGGGPYYSGANSTYQSDGTTSTSYNLTALAGVSGAPTGLAILAADDDEGPGVTFFNQPQLTGQAPANTTVDVYENPGPKQVLIAQGTTNSAGTFVLMPTVAFSPGAYTLAAVAVTPGARPARRARRSR